MKTLLRKGNRIAMGIVSLIAAFAAGCLLSAKPNAVEKTPASKIESAASSAQAQESTLAQAVKPGNRMWNSFLTVTTDAGPMFPGVWEFGSKIEPTPEEMDERQAHVHYLVARLNSSVGDRESARKALKKAEALRPEDWQIPLAAARDDLQARNFVKAIEAAESLVEKYPESFEAHLALAQANEILADESRLNKHSEDAIEHYEICLRIAPRNLKALEPLGYFYFSALQRNIRTPDLPQAAQKVIDVYQTIYEVTRGRRKLTPLQIMASVHRIQGNHKQAEALYRTMIDINPYDLRPYLNLARLYERQDQFEKAIAAYRDALIVDAKSESVQTALDRLLEAESVDRLLEFYRELAREYRSDTDIHKLYAFRLIIYGRTRDAIRAYRDIANLDRRDLESRMALVHLLIEADRFEETRTPLREIENIRGDDSVLLAALADFYGQAKMTAEAERLYAKAIELAVGDEKIRILRQVKMFYLRSENYESAFEALSTALDGLDGRRRYELQIERAGLLELMKRSEEAEKIYLELIRQQPDFSDAYLYLNNLYIAQKNYDDAIRILDQALEALDVNQGYDVRVQKAQNFMDLERYQDAEDTYQALIDDQPENSNAYLLLGQLYDETDQIKQAEKVYRQVADFDQGNWDAYNNLGYMWAERGIHLDEAKALIEKALSLAPAESGYIRDSLGWVLYQQGKFEQAADELEAAVRGLHGTPGDAEIYEHLGDTYLKLGRREDAKQAYGDAMKTDPLSESVREKLQSVDE